MKDPISRPRPPRRRPQIGRWLFHSALLVAFVSAAGAILVLPQWMELEGSRAALERQQEREQEATDRLDTLRAMNDRLHDWSNNTRRVLLPQEVPAYPGFVRAAAKREGSRVALVDMRQRPAPRWRSLTVRPSLGPELWAEDDLNNSGEIQPRSVRLVLTGKFDAIYRTVAALCGQQQLFIPDRWDLVPENAGAGETGAGTGLRAEIWATVFVVREPEEEPKTPVASGPLATGTAWEDQG